MTHYLLYYIKNYFFLLHLNNKSLHNKQPSLPNLTTLRYHQSLQPVTQSQNDKKGIAARNKISDTTFSIFRSNHQSHSSGDISVPRKSSV